MPVYRSYRDEDREFDPPPAAPPTQGGGTAPAPGTGGPLDPEPGGGGGGGGGMPPPMAPRPQFGGINIPGAPKFEFRNFVAPDRNALLSDPGYLARLDAGVRASDRGAASKGNLRTGGHQANLTEYGQGLGSLEFSNAYNRGLQAYDRDYQGAKDAFAPQFAQWQQRADAAKQGGLLGYQTDLSGWLQQQPHWMAPQSAPEFDYSQLLGDEPMAPPGGGYDPGGGYGGGPAGYEQYGEDERSRYRGY